MAAVGRDSPLDAGPGSRRWERPKVDFVAAGFVRGISYPMPVGRELGFAFIERRLQERNRLSHAGLVQRVGQNPDVALILGIGVAVKQGPAVGRPIGREAADQKFFPAATYLFEIHT